MLIGLSPPFNYGVPNQLAVNGVGNLCGAPTTATFQASEANYAGVFTAVSQNTAVATVTPTQVTGQVFTVTATTAENTNNNKTSITVSDTRGNTATESVIIANCAPP
ncbi:MAG: hypothetical protein GIX01_10985 [Candidatus Eremiobacteraeota bacterium]|nr:hypothetical protein [Candidatus Eremiobacteraeota bacterium]